MKQKFALHEEVLNTESTAEYLDLAVSTLAKMRLYGTGPAYFKLGRRVLYKLEDINAWINTNRFNSTSEYKDV